jgi:GntR family transcriptional regulator, transcriptional repressor for pyruvate dehydrogenase complex
MRVAEKILERIRSKPYGVGDKLPAERALAEEFGVSRPVVREALRMLVMLQVVDVQVGRGAFVLGDPDLAPSLHPTDQIELLDVVDVREIMETGALRLAAERADARARSAVGKALAKLEKAVGREEDTTELDRKLHAAIVEASGSPALMRIWRNLEHEISLSIRISPMGRFMSPEILAEHRQVAAGVTDGAVDEAIAAVSRLHAENRKFVEDLIEREQASSGSKSNA